MPKPSIPNSAPKIGFVSLGCPKALVDSERIITRLRAEGYEVSASYDGAVAVVVNTCGFLNSAKEESLAAIGEALAAHGKVIVTGCLGVESDRIRAAHPDVLAITGPHQYEAVVEEVHRAVSRPHDPFLDLLPPQGIRLTPRHYAYLKISEGCNNRCSFCIIPNLRGKLRSRPIGDVMREAERLVDAGVQELLVISQDTGAYGLDIGYARSAWRVICPDLAIRSTFIVGFPGETEEDFAFLLDWLSEARLARVGCFKYEDVDGAMANALTNQVPQEVKDERYARLMQHQQAISTEVLAERVGKTIEVIVDDIDGDGAIARSAWDAPEIDGNVYLSSEMGLSVGERVRVNVEDSDEYDLWGNVVARAFAQTREPARASGTPTTIC